MACVKDMVAWTKKADVGPGGWRCPCCTWARPAWMKPRMNRAVRRKIKIATRREANMVSREAELYELYTEVLVGKAG